MMRMMVIVDDDNELANEDRFDRMNTVSDYVFFQRAFTQNYAYAQFIQNLIL